MANSLYVNKVEYGNQTIIDLTGDTVTAADVRQGVSFHLPSGASGIGTAVNGYTIYMTTTSPEFYGQTITVSQNGSVIGTTSFDNQGNAQYSVDNVGTYTVSVTASGTTVSEEVVVSQIEIELEAGFQYKRWLGYTSLDPDDYASLADVLADDKAVRQLMTVHASVDYLASFTADDTSVVAILNNDIAAKWITCTAYAEDVLTDAYSALMGTIGKYGYGKWVITDNTTTPPTWGALGNVPIMTSNTAPYGEVVYSSQYDSTNFLAWHAFDGDKAFSSYGWIGGASDSAPYVGYKSTTPIKAKKAVVMVQFRTFTNANNTVITVEGSNDNSTYHSIGSLAITGIDVSSADVQKTYEIPLADEDFYLYHRIKMNYSMRPASTNYMKIAEVELYGRQMNVSVPKMDTNTSPYGDVALITTSGVADNSHPVLYAFDGDDSTYGKASYNASTVVGSEYIYQYTFAEPFIVKFAYLYHQRWGSASTVYTNGAKIEVHDVETDEWVNVQDISYRVDIAEHWIVDDINIRADKVRLYGTYISDGGGKVSLAVNTLQVYGFSYSEKEWDVSHPRHYIYDNGVELEEIEQAPIPSSGMTAYAITKDADSMLVDVRGKGANASSGAITANAIDTTPYSYLFARIGKEAGAVYASVSTTKTAIDSRVSFLNNNMNQSAFANLYDTLKAVDVSSANQSVYIAVLAWSGTAATAAVAFTRYEELWLE